MTSIHATASVDPSAKLAADVIVGAYSLIGADVTIGAGSVIGPHVVIAPRTMLGRRNRVFQFASVGECPQDKKYTGEPTTTVLGDDNVIRECVTIHAGTALDRGTTTIGNRNWFLAYVHVAHDCVIGNDVTFSNNAQLAGHVVVDDYVTLGGFAGIHQFCRIGAHAMIAAGAIVLQDVPPFLTVAGSPAKPRGTNSEGLRRRSFSADDLREIKRAYKALYREKLSLEEARARIAGAATQSAVLTPLVEFLASAGRGIVR